jgi:gliding motility-associated lipoprotein GldH
MKRQYIYLIFFLITPALFYACDKNQVFEKNISVAANGWNKDSVITFNVPISDTLQNHNIFINVRNDIKYKYSNLWLFVEINQPDNNSVIDTFDITLANPSGKWLGEGFGGVKNQQVIFKRNVYFPRSGDYKINIRQGMRENILKGISDIGIRIEKNE